MLSLSLSLSQDGRWNFIVADHLHINYIMRFAGGVGAGVGIAIGGLNFPITGDGHGGGEISIHPSIPPLPSVRLIWFLALI